MSKKQMTEDDFKFVMTKHKDLILYLTCTEELKYETNECETYPDVPGVLSINIWNADLYGDTWVELKDGIATVKVYDGHYNDYVPKQTFRTWEELDRWMSDGFIKDHLWDMSYASKELKKQYLGDENFNYDPWSKRK
jgi:hypothetical protein